MELHSLCLSDEILIPDAILSEAEKSRAAAFRSRAARRLFVAGRILCRNVIGSLIGCGPQAVSLAITPAGRPYLRDCPDIDFNLSHIKGAIALAICRGGRVGIDIESLDAFSEKEASEIMPMILSEQEFNQVQQLEGRHRHDAFLACWVQKEAVLKCFGQGFLADPLGVTLAPGSATLSSRISLSDERIFIQSGRMSGAESGDFQWSIATSSAVSTPIWQHHKSGIFF